MHSTNSTPDNVTLLRSKVRLIDVVSAKIKLTKRGNSYVGLCPFHPEKTPSFNVNCDNELFYCFGCGAKGDVIQFVSDTEGLDFKQAMQYLAELYGVELITHRSDEEAQDLSLCSLMDKAVIWLSQQLCESKVALSYLRERGITDGTIKRFRLGYVPAGGIKTYLLSLGIGIEKIQDAGLLSRNGQDCLYNRIIFPICNYMGKVISLGGRSINPEHTPKYLNSAENALFKKRESTYGIHLALGHAKKLGSIIVVEGYMDVLILSQMGVHNVVALLGTAMTEFHFRNIWSIVPEIIVWLDGDHAGLKASVKIAHLAVSMVKSGQSVRFITGQEGKDPYDVCVTHGVEFVKNLIENAKLLSEFIWEYELVNHGIVSDRVKPEQCMMLENKMREYTSAIQDSSVARHFRNFFYHQMRALQNYRKPGFRTGNNYSKIQGDASVAHNRLRGVSLQVCAEENCQMRAMYIVIECPKILDDKVVFEQFAGMDLSTNADRGLLQQNIVDIKSRGESSSTKQSLLEQLCLRGAQFKKVVDEITNFMCNTGCAFLTNKNCDEDTVKLAKREWEKLMLSKQLSDIHQQIVKLRLEGRNDLAFNLSEHAREIDEKLRNLWQC
ncbi:DNA primase [Candidatus Anaplasma sp. TIGMIC]|nr:DNA primase [Candidatus Anaplasma sp. TIGMIC]